jgi:dTDP-4-amino-4,6-dideoxygalactose transaminase
MVIPFNKPYESEQWTDLVHKNWRHSDNGKKLRHAFDKSGYSVEKHPMLFVNSATAALEVMALVTGIKPGDEVIMPSFTYAATANAFAKFGAKVIFVDIEASTLNIDVSAVKNAISERTKAIIPIHYGGVSADMDALMAICETDILLLEDGAHTVGAKFRGKLLGTMGNLGCLSFHHTKNITSGGSGGSLIVNDLMYLNPSEETIHQGTDQAAFKKGKVDAYTWQRLGGEYGMHPFSSAYLTEAIGDLSMVTDRRVKLWNQYHEALKPLQDQGVLSLAKIPGYAESNGHVFYVLTGSVRERNALCGYLQNRNISAYSHYEPLHRTQIGRRVGKHSGDMAVTMSVSERILRLPIYYDLTDEQQLTVINKIYDFYKTL